MMINSKKILLLIGVVCIALISWRVSGVINAPNLLLNPSFEADGLSGWQIVNQAGAQAVSNSSPNTPTESVLQLDIVDTPEGSWTGAGQWVSVEPNQRYDVSINYQLVDKAQSSSNILLRLSQFDQAGELINSEEVSPPGSLVASTYEKSQP